MISTTSARVAIAIATANGRETLAGSRAGVPDSLPQVLHGLDCGRVLSAVDGCDKPVRDWLLAAYAADGYPGRQWAAQCCQARLLTEYLEQRKARSCTGKVLRMAGAVIADYSLQRLGAEPASPTEYAKAVDFKLPNWSLWEQTARVMSGVIDGWDAAGLRAVRGALAWHAEQERARPLPEPLQEAEDLEMRELAELIRAAVKAALAQAEREAVDVLDPVRRPRWGTVLRLSREAA